MQTSSTAVTERWLPIPGFRRLYEVSDRGRVRSLVRRTKTGKRGGKLLHPGRNDGGYLHVSLYRKNKPRIRYVHVLVLTAFLGPCPKGQEARHGDGRRGNNRLSNLCWGTAHDNAGDRDVHGMTARGQRNGGCKLNSTLVRSVFALRRSGAMQKEIGLQLGMSQGYVSRILAGGAWAHLNLHTV